MMTGNLDTTNLFLGIMAVVSVLQALLLIAAGVMGWRLYTRAMQTVRDIEDRQVAPLVARVNVLMTKVDGILADVKGITARVEHQTERVDTAIHQTIDRVGETAGRVRSSVAGRVNSVLGLVHAARDLVGTLFNNRRHAREAPGHV